MASISNNIHTQLTELAKFDISHGIKQKFKKRLTRATDYAYIHEGFYLDLSKTHISDELMRVYMDYAQEIDFIGQRKSFLSGERINNSENRSVLHTLLRDEKNQGIEMANNEVLQEAENSKTQFFTQYQAIQVKLQKREIPVKNIIHVGIGGSALGTQLVFEALKGVDSAINIHFVGNIDAHQLVDIVSKCDVESTLVIGVSKTFSTAETLQNLDSIVDWFKGNGVEAPLDNFYGVTANATKAKEYGIASENTVSFPEWVGGRYSVWSSVSLSVSLVIGWAKFEEFLAGAAKMDAYFYTSELNENVCFLAAMMDHYYCNYMESKSKAVFAYDFRLRSLVDYLQQLETESNGKDRQRNGDLVDQKTSPVVWGGVGTDVQHSVFQMLHQGTSLIPSEFILVKHPEHNLIEHHRELLANGLAQSAALLSGQDLNKVNSLYGNDGLSDVTKKAKIFTGDRPSTTLIIEKLNAHSLGTLLAFYEHRTYCFGIFTNINSFDQMGVELGKLLATQVKPLLSQNRRTQKSVEDLDQSTLNLLEQINN